MLGSADDVAAPVSAKPPMSAVAADAARAAVVRRDIV
jgi:hypothetical protein